MCVPYEQSTICPHKRCPSVNVTNEQQVNSLSISPMQQTHLQIFGGLWGCRIVGTAAGLLNILKEQRGETVALGFCQRGLFEIQQVEAQAEQ